MVGVQGDKKGCCGMTREERLIQSIENLGLHVEPNLDTSAGDEYVVLFYNSDGTLFGDDAPCLELRDWEMVYVCPLASNRQSVRMALRNLIYDIFDVWPTEDNASDINGQRYVYDFKSFEGLAYGEV